MVPFNGKPINLNRKIPRATSGGNRFDFATWSLRFTEANQSFLDATQYIQYEGIQIYFLMQHKYIKYEGIQIYEFKQIMRNSKVYIKLRRNTKEFNKVQK